MHLNPYGEDAVNLAADLANHPPADAGELAERCREAGLVLERPVTPEDLDRVRAVLEAWEKVVDATDERERAGLVNRMLAENAAYPRLTDHAGDGWHLHYRDDEQPIGSVLFSLISVGTALHLVGRGMHRLRRCAVTGCAMIFADTSRTGRQRYCSQRCRLIPARRRRPRRTASPARRPAVVLTRGAAPSSPPGRGLSDRRPRPAPGPAAPRPTGC